MLKARKIFFAANLAVVILKSNCVLLFFHEKCVATLRSFYMDQLPALVWYACYITCL